MIKVTQITKEFPSPRSGEPQKVLDVESLQIEPGEFISLLGPSGCGKTTLLRILAGLEAPTTGRVFLGGKDITEKPVQERPIHTVFQRYALFPHMTVFENIAFPLRMRKESSASVDERVAEMLKLVRMEAFSERRPGSLSGGQAQRVAVARALANRPLLLLLDEPFSALDPQLRVSMQKELRDLQKNLKITFLMVTHDRSEAFSLSDRIAVMREGEILQIDSPRNLYHAPKSLDAARIGGPSFHLRLHGRGSVESGICSYSVEAITIEGQRIPLSFQVRGRWCSEALSVPKEVDLIVRPEHVVVRQSEAAHTIPVQLKDSFFVGDRNTLIFSLSNDFAARLTLTTAAAFDGASLFLQIPPDVTHLFPAGGEV